MKSNLKSELKNFYGEIPSAPDPQRMTQTVYRARKMMTKINECDTGISFRTFFWSQLRFIKKQVWLIQLAVILVSGFYLFQNSGAVNAVGTLSAFLPFVFLAGTGELSRAFVNGTVELEMSSRFTLKQVMLSRVTLLGLSDVLVITAACFMAQAALSLDLIQVFMYLCVPFLITSLGCLCILNHDRSHKCGFYCAVWGAAVIVLSLLLSNTLPVLYERSLFWCWCVLFALSFTGVITECILLIKSCKKDRTENFTSKQEND